MLKQITAQISSVLLDKDHEVELALTCLLASGHLLIEDKPGVGKTTLVQAMARTLGFEYARIQFTSDLLPADVIGNMIFDSVSRKFHFHPGPLFHQLVMADELNRANPRTQSALLQAMEESKVSVDGEDYTLPHPFSLIATQNPQTQIGTFPLPESQLDRFLMSLTLRAPSKEAELRLIQGHNSREVLKDLQPLLNPEKWIKMQEESQKTTLSATAAEYIYALLSETRKGRFQELSARSGQALARAARAWSYLQGRTGVRPEDIQAVVPAVFGHRLGGAQGIQHGLQLSQELVSAVAVPV